MRAARTFLKRPRRAAVSRREDAAVRADCPAVLGIVWRKTDPVEMIFRRGRNPNPSLAAVRRFQNRPAGADRKRAQAIKNI